MDLQVVVSVYVDSPSNGYHQRGVHLLTDAGSWDGLARQKTLPLIDRGIYILQLPLEKDSPVLNGLGQRGVGWREAG